MPKIPTYEQQGEYRPSGRIVQGVRTPADDGIARGIQKLGQATLEVAGRIQQANLDAELVKAETDLRVRMDKARQAIELDPETPDVAIPQRWKQESELIIGEVGGTISSSRARELWTVRARGLQAEGDTWSVNLQRKRQVDGVRAGFVAMAGEAEAMAGDLAISPETYASKIDGLRALNDSQMASGFIDKEEGARRQVALDNLALKDRTMRWSSNIDELVKQGRVAEAQAVFDTGAAGVDPATRQRVKEGLQASQQEFAVVEQGDTIWTQAGGDYGKAIELAGKIPDANLRLKVEARIGQKAQQAKAAEEMYQDGLERSLWEHVEGGGTIMNSPPSLRAAIDPGRMGSIRAYENARDAEAGMSAEGKAALREDSKALKDMFLGYLKSPTLSREFMKPMDTWSDDLKALYASMRGVDQLEVSTAIELLGTGGQSADDVTKTFNSLMRVAQVHGDPAWLLGSNSVDALESADNRDLTRALMEAAGELSAQYQGQPVPQKDLEIVVGNIFMSKKPKASWLVPREFSQEVGRQAAAVRVGQQGAAFAATSGIDWTLWNEIKAALPSDASADDVEAEYVLRGGKMP